MTTEKQNFNFFSSSKLLLSHLLLMVETTSITSSGGHVLLLACRGCSPPKYFMEESNFLHWYFLGQVQSESSRLNWCNRLSPITSCLWQGTEFDDLTGPFQTSFLWFYESLQVSLNRIDWTVNKVNWHLLLKLERQPDPCNGLYR